MTRNTFIAFTLLACAIAAQAHTNHSQAPSATEAAPEQKPWGIAGQAKSVRRTIELTMGDDMRFKPDRIEVREGDTVRLRVKNLGKLMHELVIGTPAELQAHAALMRRFPDMAHDEPYMAHVAAGKTGDLIWHFNRPGDFEFACLIAGHFEAGMKGSIRVLPAAR